MSANQQALLMASDNAVTVPEACEADPYYSCGPTDWDNVVLLLHCDQDLPFIDDSAYGWTVTTSGAASASATQSKFGGKSLLPGGTSSDYISVANDGAFDWGTGDVTVEYWCYRTGSGGEGINVGNGIKLGINTSFNTLAFNLPGGGSGVVGSALTINTWYHIAATRESGTWRLFVNGALVRTNSSSPGTSSSPTGSIVVGYGTYLGPFLGYIDDVRITTGIARYTEDFSIPTTAFSNYAGVWTPNERTVLLLHADETPPIDDSCYQPKTVTLTGTASISATETRFGAGSFSVANAGTSTANGVVITDHMDFDFGDRDFTIEMWAYRSSNTYYGTLFYFTTSAEFSLLVAPTTGNIVLNYRSSGGTQANISTGVTFPLTTWQHVVVQRRGTNFEFYLNGVLGNTTAITGGASSTVNSTGDFYLGRTTTSSALTWAGYIDEVRVTRGVARYPTSFTPPAQPNCNSVVPGNSISIPGTSPLTGMSVTVRQQTIGDQNGAVALSGISATVNAGGLFSDSVTSSKTVALIGRSVTVSRGSVTVPAYPNLSSSNRSYFIITSPTAASLTVTFRPDGTWSAVDGEGATLFSGTWIDTAQTAYDIESISHLYRVLAVNIFVGYAPYYSYPTTPFTLSSDFVFVAQNLTYGTTVNFDFQITIAPTSANPRYGEAYYYGTHRFNTAIELAG